MAITNGYCTLAEYQAFHGISDMKDLTILEDSIGAASRRIDGFAGRRFWQDGSVVTTEFRADDEYCLEVPQGISTTTGLVIKTDADADGTFETTWTTADYVLEPFDAADRTPVWPFTRIVAVGAYEFPQPINRRPGVQVTAKFGFPAVPDDVKRACLILARDLLKAKDVLNDVAGTTDYGTIRVPKLSRQVEGLLEQYRLTGAVVG